MNQPNRNPQATDRPGATPQDPRGKAGDRKPATGTPPKADDDIPDDYGQETSHPDDLEPPDEHERR